MALTYPLSLGAFADRLLIAAVTWSLRTTVETSGTKSGQIITNETAPRLWQAEVACDRMSHRDAAFAQARVEALGPSYAFYLTNPALPSPADDPASTRLAGFSPTLSNISTNRLQVKIAGLPTGYKLTPGDFFHFDYGTPSRRAFHRVVENATADGSGEAGNFEVRPAARTGAVTGAAVTLYRPAARMLMVPGSVDHGRAGPVHVTGMGFTAVETL